MLIGTGDLMPAQDAEVAASARRHTLPLNGFILRQALMGLSLGVLASPVTGTGIALDRSALLFVCAMADGHADAETLARSVSGATQDLAQRFLDDTLPMLRALGVASSGMSVSTRRPASPIPRSVASCSGVSAVPTRRSSAPRRRAERTGAHRGVGNIVANTRK